MKYFYIAAAFERNGERWACVHTVTPSANLAACSLNDGSGCIWANLCETKKHAVELVGAWNKQFAEQGVT